MDERMPVWLVALVLVGIGVSLVALFAQLLQDVSPNPALNCSPAAFLSSWLMP